jgi:hypothetical protein
MRLTDMNMFDAVVRLVMIGLVMLGLLSPISSDQHFCPQEGKTLYDMTNQKSEKVHLTKKTKNTKVTFGTYINSNSNDWLQAKNAC